MNEINKNELARERSVTIDKRELPKEVSSTTETKSTSTYTYDYTDENPITAIVIAILQIALLGVTWLYPSVWIMIGTGVIMPLIFSFTLLEFYDDDYTGGYFLLMFIASVVFVFLGPETYAVFSISISAVIVFMWILFIFEEEYYEQLGAILIVIGYITLYILYLLGIVVILLPQYLALITIGLVIGYLVIADI